ncbi:hypothetical protein [Stratiformator vulcanicus]|uniref:Uncharacterized protein n=1 Tax=Stratiformator vulcanicus TaxID=2527980 RepID=A0A517QZ67_9PLAN|nr:hypothetical protein [Stratiformator vulcanicus]QDT36893.1 hypothetical protein Pan189_12570 [Stratiformator vulcanicus]
MNLTPNHNGVRQNCVRRLTQVAWLTLLLPLLVLSTINRAKADDEPLTLTGRWQRQANEEEDAKRAEAIKEAVRNVPRPFQSQAAQKLQKATSPSPVLNIDDQRTQITLTFNEESVTLPTDGTTKTLSGKAGRGSITARRKDGRLQVSMQGQSGSRTTEYLLSRDGQYLATDITMSVQALKTPIRYRVIYRRQ